MRFLRATLCTIAILLSISPASRAQEVGSCDTGKAAAFLDANRVRAAIYNAGNLFWKGSGNIYTVPLGQAANAIFATNIWIGGLVDGELRFAGTDYGPLTEGGTLPNPSDCSEYDRIYEVTVLDLERLEETGEATDDIRDWPWQLGAPVVDGDDNPNNYDVEGGDRPEITGHQMLWWVMNDVGGPHGWSDTRPLGIEVRVSAFAVLSSEPALDHATFYRYRITNKQSYTIDSTYFGLWTDGDLGNASDDYVGSDTTLGMGFYYNGDNEDETSRGYGKAPPALGYDFVSGPLVNDDGRDNDGDGETDELDERLGMSIFLYYNGDSTPQGNPSTAWQAYNYLRGIWRDGKPMTVGGTGYGGDQPTSYMFPGDPATKSFWSEVNVDGAGSRNTPSDRRFLLSTGPFRLDPGDTKEIVTAIVWARGDDYLDSVAELREADRVVQDAWDASALKDVPIPQIDSRPPVLLSPANGVLNQPTGITLNWSHVPYASEYGIEIATSPNFDGPSYRTLSSITNTVEVDSLMPHADYYWRVRAQSALFETQLSDTYRFETSDIQLGEVGVQMIPRSRNPAFLEIVGPGGVDPCGPNAGSTGGCREAGGNLVYGSYNSTGEYVMYHVATGPEATLPYFAPNDYDIRFTEEGSYALHPFRTGRLVWVPFEVWDVGPVGLFNENDPADDVQLIPVLFSDGGGECTFGYDEGDDPFGLGWGMSDRIYAYYATSTYGEWEAAVQPLVENAPDRCHDGDETLNELIDFNRGRPLQRITFNGDPAAGNAPGEGTVIRFYTTPGVAMSPILAAPASGTGPYVQPLTLFWNAQRGSAVEYQIQISPGPTFENAVLDATTSDESFVVSGLSEGKTYLWRARLTRPQSPWSKIWTFTAGEVTNVAAEPTSELPTELTLEQNYPNPFNPSTTVRFGLPEGGRARVVVYDLLGRRVATLLDQTLTAGWHTTTWDASAHASGVYVYAIETRDRRISKSLVVVK